MPDADRPKVIKVSDSLTIVESIPYLLGFQPAESLVVVALVPPRERMSFCFRVDLVPDDDAYAASVAEMARERMRQAGAVAVVIAVFTGDRGDDPDLPHRELVDRLEAAVDVPVREAVLVTLDRFWSYLCAEPRCCPPSGTPRDLGAPGPLALAAAHAMEGRAVLPSREAVVAGVAPVTGLRAWSMHGALFRAQEDWMDDPRGFIRRAGRLLGELAERYADPRATIDDDEAAVLAIAMRHVMFRDRLIVKCADDGDDRMRRLVADVARLAQPPSDAPAVTVLAAAAYLDGDGLTASVAIDRALATNPAYSLARLLRDALARQVPPSGLADTWRGALGNRAVRRARARKR